MKSGETRFIVKKLDLKDEDYNSVAFRLSNGKTTIKKSTDAQDTKDKVLVQDGVFLIPLQQTDTKALEGNVTLEAQINYENHSVRKSDDNFMFIGSTLGTDIIEGSEPAEDDGIEVVMTAIEEGVAVIVNPESADELITRVTRLFQDTKAEADEVYEAYQRGDLNGKDGVDGKDGQDGQDGYSPQVTVKTETPSTYVLHIKDADHEFDTPNLQGQGGEGTLEAGDGLKRAGNVISVDNGDYLYFDPLNNRKLDVNTTLLGQNQALRIVLTTVGTNPLASKQYVDNLMSGAVKRLVVESLPTEDIDTNTIYMVLKSVPSTNNIYDEYMYINNAWELIGTTEVDLSNYYTKTESDNRYEPKLTLGDGLRKGANDVLQVKLALSEVENPNYIIFDNVYNGLFFDYYTLGYNTSLRANLTSDSYQNPLASKSDLSSKQDTIDSTHKLNADYVNDSNSTNKFVPSHSSSDENKVLSVDSNGGLVWVTSSGGHKIVESNNNPPTTSSDYEVGDEWIKGGAEVFKCVAKNGTSLTWGNLSLNNYDDLVVAILGGNS